MKGKVRIPIQLTYLLPKVNKKTYKFARYLKLSVKAQRRLDAIEIYQKSENIKVKEIADAYKIHPFTFYRWLKRYNPKRVESLEDRSRRPKNPRKPKARIPEYVKSPKMNCYVEKVIDTVQLECEYKLEDLEGIEEVNKELNKFLIYYNFYRPHQSLLYKTPIYYYNQNLYNTTKNNLLHMYRTQTIFEVTIRCQRFGLR